MSDSVDNERQGGSLYRSHQPGSQILPVTTTTTTTNELNTILNQNNNCNNNNNPTANVNGSMDNSSNHPSKKPQKLDSPNVSMSSNSIGRNRDNRNWRTAQKDRTIQPPIDPKNWFDVLVSCGFGAKSYKLGPGFCNPRFKVRFVTKVYLVLLLQLLVSLLWMSLVLTSKSLRELYESSSGILICATIIYVLIYSGLRLTRCGGDPMCFMSYMIMFIFLTTCCALASGAGAVVWSLSPFLLSAIWLTIATLALTNTCCTSINILTNSVYAVAIFAGLFFSGVLAALYIHLGFVIGPLDTGYNLLYFTLPLGILPTLAGLALVYELKKLIGGRRIDLEDDQWIVAAIIL